MKLIKKITTDRDHDKRITIHESDTLTAENFPARLAQSNLTRKNDIANFVKGKDFDYKLKKSNKDVTANKNELNELSKEVKVISTKGLTKNLINRFSILDEAKSFSSGIFHIYLVLIIAKKYIKYFSATT